MNKKIGLLLGVLVILCASLLATTVVTPAAVTTAPNAGVHNNPAACTFKGEVYAFARGQDNRLYYTNIENAKWEYLGGVLSSGPAVTATDNTMYIFVRGSDGFVYYITTNDGWRFSEWKFLSDGVVA